MDTIFMISKNIKTSDHHRLLLTDKINLKRSDNGKIQKKSLKSNKFKIPAPTWNGEFELPDGSYSVWDIQDYFWYIF